MSVPGITERIAALIAPMGASVAEVAALIARYGTVQPLREGRAFAWQEDPAERCALVLSGRLLPVKRRLGAESVTLPALFPGDWAALAEAVAQAPAQADYIAEGAAELLVIPVRNLAVLAAQAAFAPYLAQALARECLSLHGWILGGGPRERILSWLLTRRRSLGGLENRRVAATQAGIARELSLARETVNRHLARLESEGLLSAGRGEVEIPDWEAIVRSLAEG